MRSRDTAVQKAKTAEGEAARWKQQAEAAATLQQQVDSLKQTVASLEGQVFESRQFEMQMARITSSLERERDVLQREVLKYAGAESADSMAEQLRLLQEKLRESAIETKRLREDAVMMKRLHQDQLDAEQVLSEGLQQQLDHLRGTMGTGIEVRIVFFSLFVLMIELQELRSRMEEGLHAALNRVDQMETLLWNERGKTKKYLQLLTQLVDKDDLEVLLDEDGDQDENK